MTESLQIVFPQAGQIALERHEAPEPGPGELIARVRRVGICATDVHLLDGHIGDPFPLVPGHEFVGEVAALGEGTGEARGLAVGDRIAIEMSLPCGSCRWCRSGSYNLCALDDAAHGAPGREYGVNMPQTRAPGFWGGYAEHLFVPERAIVHPIPEHIDWDAAALVEPLAVSCRAVARSGIRHGDSVVVIGPGPVGLLTAAAARDAGAARVVLVGTRDSRLELGRRFGADATVNSRERDAEEAVRAELGGLADVVIETAGVAAAQEQAVQLARRGGTVVLAGACGTGVPITFHQDLDILLREVTITASFLSAGGFEPALAMLSAGRFPYADLVTHRFPLERAAEALDVVRGKRDGVMKAVLVPGEPAEDAVDEKER